MGCVTADALVLLQLWGSGCFGVTAAVWLQLCEGGCFGVTAAILLGLKAQQAKYKYLACCGHMSLGSCASFSERVADYFSASASRNNSLRPILERVFSSTRFTITAAYKEYLPSLDGRLPDTTTEYGGTLPYMISPVVRS